MAKEYRALNPVAMAMYERISTPEQIDATFLKHARLNGMKVDDIDFTKSFDFPTGSTLGATVVNPLSGSQVDRLMREFNPNNFLSMDVANESYSTIMGFSQELDKMFTYVTGSQELYKVNIRAQEGERLYSADSNTTTRTGKRDDLYSILGFDLLIKAVGDEYDIPSTLIANNLWNQDFVGTINTEMMKVRSEDVSKLLTMGRGQSGVGTNTGKRLDKDFFQVVRGYEHLLKWLDADNTFSVERKSVLGEHGFHFSPNRVNLTKINALATWNGSHTYQLLDEMFLAMPEDYRDDPSNVYVLNSTDFFRYMQYRTNIGETVNSTVVGVNTETRENAIQNGMIPRHRGIRIVTNRWAKQISKGGMVVFGDMKEILVATSPEANSKNIFFNARNGAGSWEYTDVLRYGTGVRNKQKLVVAFSTYGYAADGKTETTAEVKAPLLYAVDKAHGSTVASVALTSIAGDSGAYLFADMTPERYKMIYKADPTGADDDAKIADIIATGTKVDAGFDASLLDADVYSFIVYDELGLLDVSEIQLVTITS